MNGVSSATADKVSICGSIAEGEWILIFRDFDVWRHAVIEKKLMGKELRPARNIFKKVAKIPPGELQECAFMIKEADETED